LKGYVQVYTGDGKGKTTAAIGLCVRAVGAGKRVLFVQFLKKGDFSEVKALGCFGRMVHVKQFGSGRFVRGKPCKEDRELAAAGLRYVEERMGSGEYDVVVLDEINVAMNMGLVSVPQVLDLLADKPDNIELVLTGRYAPTEIVDAADLVTECRMVRHYFARGVRARQGIEK